MENPATPPEIHAQRLDAIGAQESKAARRAAGARSYQAKVEKALALMESMDSEEAILTSVRQMAVKALPGAMRNLVSMALGTKKGCPASVQREAIAMVAGAAGQAFEAPKSGGARGPMAEMTLAEIDATLLALLERSRDAQALEVQGTLLPNSGSESEAAGSEAGAGAQAAVAHPRPGGAEEER